MAFFLIYTDTMAELTGALGPGYLGAGEGKGGVEEGRHSLGSSPVVAQGQRTAGRCFTGSLKMAMVSMVELA